MEAARQPPWSLRPAIFPVRFEDCAGDVDHVVAGALDVLLVEEPAKARPQLRWVVLIGRAQVDIRSVRPCLEDRSVLVEDDVLAGVNVIRLEPSAGLADVDEHRAPVLLVECEDRMARHADTLAGPERCAPASASLRAVPYQRPTAVRGAGPAEVQRARPRGQVAGSAPLRQKIADMSQRASATRV